MPYITQDRRDPLDEPLAQIILAIQDSTAKAGMLNYAITTLLQSVVDPEAPRYVDINTAVGVLECAKLELYRRLAAGYEDKKAAENGDVDTYVVVQSKD